MGSSYTPAKLCEKKDIIKSLKSGRDCTIKAPFDLTLEIPPGKYLKKSRAINHCQRTDFYDLRSLDGARVGLKYYPKYWSHEGFGTSIAVRIHDPEKNEKLYGVNAEVTVNGDKYRIDDYGEKKYRKENFNFAVKIGESERFLKNETYLAEGVTITVKGYVFVWDPRLFSREMWKLEAGVVGHKNIWNNPVWPHDIYFETKNGIIGANLAVLAANCEEFREMKESMGGPEESKVINAKKFHRDVVEIGLKLCYDARLVRFYLTFDQKLELLLFFNRFEVSNYKEQLEQHLLEYLDRVTVGRIYRASIYALSDCLKKKALELIKDCIFTNKYFIGQDFDHVCLAMWVDKKRTRLTFQNHYIPKYKD